MSIWFFLLIIFAAGAIGGSVNAFITDNGFAMPKKAQGDRGNKIYQPGFLGNMFIGGIAACVSWGLYGPFANAYIIGKSSESSSSQPPGITVAALVGAVLVGIGGARWLTNEVDKTLLRAAATEAASGNKNDDLARELFTASPAVALKKAAEARDDVSQ